MATPNKGPLAAHCVLLKKKGRKNSKRAATREKIVDVMIAIARKDPGSNSKVLSFKNALHMAATSGAIALETATRDKTMSLTEAMKLLKKFNLRKWVKKNQFSVSTPQQRNLPYTRKRTGKVESTEL